MLKKFVNSFSIYRGLPTDIYYIAVARFVLGLGNFIIPFLFLLLTLKLGYSATSAGGLAMGVTLFYLLGNFSGGKLSDSLGHKKIMVFGELAGSGVLILSGFFHDWHLMLPVLLFISYFFFGIALPASNALVADLSTPENRNAVISFSYLSYNLGSGVGPVLAGYLFRDHTVWIFIGNGLAGLIGILIVILGVRHHYERRLTPPAEPGDAEEAKQGTVWRVFKERPWLLVFGVLCTFLWFSVNQMTIVTPLFLAHRYGENGPWLFGQLMTFASLLVVIITPILIRVTGQTCEIKSLALAGFLFAAGYLFVMLFSPIAMQFVAWFFLSAGEVLLLTKEGVYLANQSPVSHRGRINSIMTTLRSLGLMPACILMGACIQSFGYITTWWVIIIISLITAVALLLLSHHQKQFKYPTAPGKVN
ncbi:MFS transporter [Tatumella ptyseos]|uniref:MFS transporter n=1 Tax=Tatumella ptyseos TaxID=82987 RepID=UPI0023F2FD70|nr:MFS transporter [Tatumella ptyseos]